MLITHCQTVMAAITNSLLFPSLGCVLGELLESSWCDTYGGCTFFGFSYKILNKKNSNQWIDVKQQVKRIQRCSSKRVQYVCPKFLKAVNVELIVGTFKAIKCCPCEYHHNIYSLMRFTMSQQLPNNSSGFIN